MWWPDPLSDEEKKFKELQALFLTYEQELRELNRKYSEELVAASTGQFVQAHGELDRKFINQIRPIFERKD